MIWSLGMSLSIIASGEAGFAISYGLGQGATMIAAFWGRVYLERIQGSAGWNEQTPDLHVFIVYNRPRADNCRPYCVTSISKTGYQVNSAKKKNAPFCPSDIFPPIGARKNLQNHTLIVAQQFPPPGGNTKGGFFLRRYINFHTI